MTFVILVNTPIINFLTYFLGQEVFWDHMKQFYLYKKSVNLNLLNSQLLTSIYARVIWLNNIS